MIPVLIEITEKGKHKKATYSCQCGSIFSARVDHVNKGLIKSCGCLRNKLSADRKRTHGEASKTTRTPEYKTWASMIQRCTDSKVKSFANYGGRGIVVCERWRNSFPNFLENMGRRPSSDYSIDRIDVNGNYEPSNCRWATRKEQMNNMRKHLIHE